MAILSIPNQQVELNDPQEIRAFMNQRGIFFDQWFCDVIFDDSASTEEILAAYAADLDPFMKSGGTKRLMLFRLIRPLKITLQFARSFLQSIRILKMKLGFLSMDKDCFGSTLKMRMYLICCVNEVI